MNLKPIWIYFENGTFLEANAFGKGETRVGEAVFNTSMTGYEEIITDPSYAGQFIVFTMPEIGIVGTNEDDMESKNIHASGILVRNLSEIPSNFRSDESLSEFIQKYDGMGICDIDTRFITKMLRDEGSMMMVASTKISDKNELKAILEKAPRIEEIGYVGSVSTKESYIHKSGNWDDTKLSYNEAPKSAKKVVVIDFGVKRAILNCLCDAGLEVEVIPYDFNENELIKRYKDGEIQGVFLSNGPGDPLQLKLEKQKVANLVNADIPMFAICLGHQLLSIAQGYPSYKMKFGQHGANHPVLDMKSKKVEITSQNHNYNVPKSIEEIATITHFNLFDNIVEGVEYNDKQIFSVQHHPEASPGPQESRSIFKTFADMI